MRKSINLIFLLLFVFTYGCKNSYKTPEEFGKEFFNLLINYNEKHIKNFFPAKSDCQKIFDATFYGENKNEFYNSFLFSINEMTLSKATIDIIEKLPSTITIKAYFSNNLPLDMAKAKWYFHSLLLNYYKYSNGKIVYEFIDPNKDKESEKEAIRNGIRPVFISFKEKDQVKQQKAYLGAVIQLGEETDVIPFMQPGLAMEYALSSRIKKLSMTNKPVIGLLQGHGEPDIGSFKQVMNQLQVLYNVETITLTDSTNELSQYPTVAIVSPTDSFPESHLQQLNDFLANGGNLFIACNRVEGDLKQVRGYSVNTGLESWLAEKGLIIENNFVIDASCASMTVIQKQGSFSIHTPMQSPYIPVITNFADHPVTKGLEAVIMQFASSITFAGDSSISFLPLAKTSEKSGTKSAPTNFDISGQWTERDFPLSELTVAALAEGPFVGDKKTKIVLISDGNFPVNGEDQNAQQLQPDNVSLMVNAILYLSDYLGLINLRTKNMTELSIDSIKNITNKTFYFMMINIGKIEVELIRNRMINDGFSFNEAKFKQVDYKITKTNNFEKANINIIFTLKDREYNISCNNCYKLRGKWYMLSVPEWNN